MHSPYQIPAWKTAPFIRLLLPFIAGIILQWYQQFPLPVIVAAMLCFTFAILLFRLFHLAIRFKLQSLQGFTIHLLLFSIGLFVTWQKDIRHTNDWFGNYYQDSDRLVVRIDEPIIEKTKSYKAEGSIESIVQGNERRDCEGKLLIYFSKEDISVKRLQYGDKILVNKSLQPIKNSGNPGAFNYEQYAAFQQTFHNVFLKERDWVVLNEKNVNRFDQFIFIARENILSVLRKNINSNKDELGIAEALLIGYTNDLDKDLVQAYSNTGVVHIIAISGMHLGLIYVMLVWIFKRIPLINRSKIVQVILILSCLWIFSLLTGASASVLRSAVMFTFITIGKSFSKRSSIYNALAASAFVMLCYNPYFLWDVGFQLSYFAVVGIIIFQRPIYNWLYIKNKWVNKIWELVAISLAAQTLTFPICIYYFHQFPNLFLITNLIAVPLSTIILFAEIFLEVLAWIPFIGVYLGKITAWMVWLMNTVIMGTSKLSFAVWDNIPATILSTILLYATVIGSSVWLMGKNKQALRLFLISLLGFLIIIDCNKWQSEHQQELIAYNVPQYRAIDIVNGNDYQFIGDSILLENALLQNFHLKPGRIALQSFKKITGLPAVFQNDNFYQVGGRRILLIDKPINFAPLQQKIHIDVILISKSPKLRISQLASVFNCDQYVFDASNSLWKIGKWKKECEQLLLRCQSVPEQGAFILSW